MITESKINNIGDIKPIIVGAGNDPSKVKFGQVFGNPYNTTFLCAKRKSGKTSVLGEILDKTINKKTVIWVFCPTTNVDDSWKAIISKLQKKGNIVNVFDSIMEGKKNQLTEIIDELARGEEEEEKVPKIKSKKLICCDDNIEEEKETKYKPKKISPEHVFILDDLSHELKNPAVYKLLKNGRHLKASCYISFQWPMDIMPAGWKNCEYAICFKSFSEDKLEHIYKQLDLTIPLQDFINIYKYVMKDNKYDFLFIDAKNEKFRKNFNKELNF
jgi:hypothetical protein